MDTARPARTARSHTRTRPRHRPRRSKPNGTVRARTPTSPRTTTTSPSCRLLHAEGPGGTDDEGTEALPDHVLRRRDRAARLVRRHRAPLRLRPSDHGRDHRPHPRRPVHRVPRLGGEPRDEGAPAGTTDRRHGLRGVRAVPCVLGRAPRGLVDEARSGVTDSTDNPWLRRRVIAYAHQGGAWEGPSSTLYAIALGLAHGATAVELDVHATKDRRLVVCHDETVDRTTNGAGQICDLTFDELRQLDNAYWWAPGADVSPGLDATAYPLRGSGPRDADFGIAPLAAVLERFPGIPVNLDIKRTAPDVEPYEALLAAELRAFGRGDDTIVASLSDPAVPCAPPRVGARAGASGDRRVLPQRPRRHGRPADRSGRPAGPRVVWRDHRGRRPLRRAGPPPGACGARVGEQRS